MCMFVGGHSTPPYIYTKAAHRKEKYTESERPTIKIYSSEHTVRHIQARGANNDDYPTVCNVN